MHSTNGALAAARFVGAEVLRSERGLVLYRGHTEAQHAGRRLRWVEGAPCAPPFHGARHPRGGSTAHPTAGHRAGAWSVDTEEVPVAMPLLLFTVTRRGPFESPSLGVGRSNALIGRRLGGRTASRTTERDATEGPAAAVSGGVGEPRRRSRGHPDHEVKSHWSLFVSSTGGTRLTARRDAHKNWQRFRNVRRAGFRAPHSKEPSSGLVRSSPPAALLHAWTPYRARAHVIDSNARYRQGTREFSCSSVTGRDLIRPLTQVGTLAQRY